MYQLYCNRAYILLCGVCFALYKLRYLRVREKHFPEGGDRSVDIDVEAGHSVHQHVEGASFGTEQLAPSQP